MKNHREHFGATEMAPTGSSPVDGHEKSQRTFWRDRDGTDRRSMVMKNHREHFGATGSSLLDGHEKSQRAFWRDRDGTDRTVAARWS